MIIGDATNCKIASEKGCQGCIHSDEDKIEYGNCREDDLSFDEIFINFNFKDQLSSHHKKISSSEVQHQIYEAYEEKNMYKLRVALKHYLKNKEKYIEERSMSEKEFYEKYNYHVRNNNLCLNTI
jgi:hypothetical protein